MEWLVVESYMVINDCLHIGGTFVDEEIKIGLTMVDH